MVVWFVLQTHTAIHFKSCQEKLTQINDFYTEKNIGYDNKTGYMDNSDKERESDKSDTSDTSDTSEQIGEHTRESEQSKPRGRWKRWRQRGEPVGESNHITAESPGTE